VKYEKVAGQVTAGETYLKMLDHLRELQECAAVQAHLARANDEGLLADRWLAASETFRMWQNVVTHLATKGVRQ